MIGVTPEAQTMEMAFGGKEPEEIVEIHLEDLCEAERQLTNESVKPDGKVDIILLGCPHYSYSDCQKVVELFRGRRVHTNLDFWITVGRDTCDRMKDSGLYEEVERLGIKIYKEGCALEIRAKKHNADVLMSDSGKFGVYSFGLTGLQPVFASLNECVETAVAGKLVKEAKPWRK